MIYNDPAVFMRKESGPTEEPEYTEPVIVPVQSQNGDWVVGLLCDEAGNEVLGVPSGGLYVTPISVASDADPAIGEPLLMAQEQIQAASSLTELCPEVEEAAGNLGLDVSKLVVRSLFDVSVFGLYAEYLYADGYAITIRFDFGLASNVPLLILHNYADADWEALHGGLVVRNDDGSVDVTFYSLSPIAVVVEN